jgi:uncharacterized membrane protein YhaH (DUF805 family)
MNRYKLLSWLALLISIILLILPRIVPICNGTDNGHPMQCHYAYQAEFIVTLLAVILSASLLVVRTAEARLLASVIILLLGISIIVLPQSWAIGICENGSCGKTTFFECIGGGVLAVTGALIALLTYKEQQEEGK